MTNNPASTTAEVLTEEFVAIHGPAFESQLPRGGWATRAEARFEPRRDSEFDAERKSFLEYLKYVARVRIHIDRHGMHGHAALCLSGGGIRSGAFALGVVQGLAYHGLLDRFHYLSTVSGGGYVGAWLSAWRTRAAGAPPPPGDLRPLTELASPDDSIPLRHLRYNQEFLTPKAGLGSPDTWAGLVAWFRNLLLNWLVTLPLLLAMMLVPQVLTVVLGAAERASTGVTYILIVTVPAAVALVSILYGWCKSRPDRLAPTYVAGRVRIGTLLVLPAALTSAAFTFAAVMLHDRPWWWFFIAGWLCFAVMRIAALALWRRVLPKAYPGLSILPLEIIAGAATGAIIAGGKAAAGPAFCCVWAGWLQVDPYLARTITLGPAWVLIAIMVGEFICALFWTKASENVPRSEWLARSGGYLGALAISWMIWAWISLFAFDELTRIFGWWFSLALGGPGLAGLAAAASPLTRVSQATKPGWVSMQTLSTFLCLVLLLLVLILFAYLGTRCLLAAWQWLIPDSPTRIQRAGIAVGVFFAAITFAVAMSFLVKINWFGLGVLYRARLIRTFLGASAYLRPSERDPFTDFKRSDDLGLHELDFSDGASSGHARLYHVINATVNTAATRNLAWQERKAGPFVFTKAYCGGDAVGYRPSTEFACLRPTESAPDRSQPITLGTATAVSGAAISSNWGYHTSPITSMIMALFNVRLGWWMGNPHSNRKRGAPAWRKETPWSSLHPICIEALGMTTEDAAWLYLSDGGHFDNLGAYEMIRRRCRLLVIADAGQDEKAEFFDLGGFVRKVKIDFGVIVRFGQIFMIPRNSPPLPGVHCGVASVEYPEDEGKPSGMIVYLKPGLYGAEPIDIRAYAATNQAFPHDTTLNQWFGEAQLESYRGLGGFIIDQIMQGPKRTTLTAFAQAAQALVARHAAQFPQQPVRLVQTIGS